MESKFGVLDREVAAGAAAATAGEGVASTGEGVGMARLGVLEAWEASAAAANREGV